MPRQEDVPTAFYDRADEMIAVANRQSKSAKVGDVSASSLYAVARFNAFASAIAHRSSEGLSADKAEILDYFTGQYRAMLEEQLDDHVANFDVYLKQQS